ncbi:uncharacterized protein LOC124497448 [Dermatophagoides farinae]|uniref:uncharacterized protein LOC124497448 n=1 Tax=Dermatophagoides farinae TaxID=6954 RepID=UPI003F61DF69
MKNFLPILLLLTLSSSLLIGNHFMANGQLIIDENDPSGQRIIHLLMDTINDYQHKHSDNNHDYKLKRLVYTFGESPKYSVELIVIDDQTKQTLMCTVELFEHESSDHKTMSYTTGAVKCHHE